MAALDVEALLESTAKGADDKRLKHADDEGSPKSDRRDRDRTRDRDDSRERDREYYDRKRRERRERSSTRSRRDSPAGSYRASTPRSDTGSHKSRRRSRSRDDDRRHSRRHRGVDGDRYRRSGRSRSRSRSPYGRRRGEYRDRRDRADRYGGDNRRPRDDDRRDARRRDATPPQLTEDERDRRTVFVQQLAARLRTRELKEFFEKVGGVTEAQIVKDRISGRSKGYVPSFAPLVSHCLVPCFTNIDIFQRVGYVEFKDEDSVTQALQLTGQKLLGIPIIVQVTEAEKNRQVRNTEGSSGHPNSIPFHRLYVGNIHFNVTEQDLQAVFEPFGELEFVQLQKDEQGRSRGYGFVQYVTRVLNPSPLSPQYQPNLTRK